MSLKKSLSLDFGENQNYFFVILIIIGTVLLYYPTTNQILTNFDEIRWINRINQPTLETLKLIVTKDAKIWENLGYFAPVSAISFWSDSIFLHSLGQNFAVYKITNLFLHVINCVLTFFLMGLLGFNSRTSFCISILFSIHPLQVSTICWVAERKNLLMTVFYLGSLIFYLTFRKTGKYWKYVSALISSSLALMSKPSAVAIAPTLLITDWLLVDKKFSKQSLIRLLPFFIIAFAWGIVATVSEGAEHINFSLMDRLLFVPYKIFAMLGKAFLPIDLSFIYPQVKEESAILVFWLPLLSLMILSLLVTMLGIRYDMIILWGGIFYLFNLAPSLGIVKFQGMIILYIADHYQYIALIGFLVTLSAIARIIAPDIKPLQKRIGFAILCSFLIIIARGNIRIWDDPESLWLHVLDKNPNNFTANYDLAHYYEGVNELRLAEHYYNKAINSEPEGWSAYNNLGVVKAKQNQFDDAINLLNRAIELKPDLPQAHRLLANIHMKLGQNDLAQKHCQFAQKYGVMCSSDDLLFSQKH